MSRAARGLSALCLVILFTGSPLAADPHAATVSQVEWNAKTQKLEIALRASPEALERALGAYFNTEVKLGNDAKIERRIQRYLKDTFIVESPALATDSDDDPEPATIEWVGFERPSHREVWLYFEVPLPRLEGARITVRLFFELEPRQLHVVRLRNGETQSAWTLTRDEPSQVLWPTGSSTGVGN